MLNFTRVHCPVMPNYPQTVTHNNAPTAEHMRLLDEFRREAQASIIKEVALKSNDLHAKILIQENFIKYGKTITCIYEINGKRVSFSVDIQRGSHAGNMDKFRDALLASLAKEIVFNAEFK